MKEGHKGKPDPPPAQGQHQHHHQGGGPPREEAAIVGGPDIPTDSMTSPEARNDSDQSATTQTIISSNPGIDVSVSDSSDSSNRSDHDSHASDDGTTGRDNKTGTTSRGILGRPAAASSSGSCDNILSSVDPAAFHAMVERYSRVSIRERAAAGRGIPRGRAAVIVEDDGADDDNHNGYRGRQETGQKSSEYP